MPKDKTYPKVSLPVRRKVGGRIHDLAYITKEEAQYLERKFRSGKKGEVVTTVGPRNGRKYKVRGYPKKVDRRRENLEKKEAPANEYFTNDPFSINNFFTETFDDGKVATVYKGANQEDQYIVTGLYGANPEQVQKFKLIQLTEGVSPEYRIQY